MANSFVANSQIGNFLAAGNIHISLRGYLLRDGKTMDDTGVRNNSVCYLCLKFCLNLLKTTVNFFFQKY